MAIWKSILAGIGGGLLALVLYAAVLIVPGILSSFVSGDYFFVSVVHITSPLPLLLAALGFATGFILIFRTSR